MTRADDIVIVKELSAIDEEDGIIVNAVHKKNHINIALSDLDVEDEDSTNYQMVDDYTTWLTQLS